MCKAASVIRQFDHLLQLYEVLIIRKKSISVNMTAVPKWGKALDRTRHDRDRRTRGTSSPSSTVAGASLDVPIISEDDLAESGNEGAGAWAVMNMPPPPEGDRSKP